MIMLNTRFIDINYQRWQQYRRIAIHGTDVPVVINTPGVDEVDEVDVNVDPDDPLQFGSVSCADNL